MESKNNIVIVTRHLGAIEWLRRQGIVTQILEHANADDVRGKIVIGNVPLALAAEAAEVWAIEMPDLKYFQRGRDLTADEMEAAGARMRKYVVHAKNGDSDER